MGDDNGGKPPVAGSELSAAEVRAFVERAPRSKFNVAVSCRLTDERGGVTAVEAELVNVSSSGMFVSGPKLLPIGAVVAFQFKLDDGVVALAGKAEVMRRELRGMGMRFVSLDEGGREILARLVEPPAPDDAGVAAVELGHGTARIRLSPATARWFTANPLLHIGVGGCFVPAGSAPVALGADFELAVIDDATDRVLLRCRAKVAATQEGRIGLRFLDAEREALQALRAEIARMTTGRPATKLPPAP
jgi:hypothetical protein